MVEVVKKKSRGRPKSEAIAEANEVFMKDDGFASDDPLSASTLEATHAKQPDWQPIPTRELFTETQAPRITLPREKTPEEEAQDYLDRVFDGVHKICQNNGGSFTYNRELHNIDLKGGPRIAQTLILGAPVHVILYQVASFFRR